MYIVQYIRICVFLLLLFYQSLRRFNYMHVPDRKKTLQCRFYLALTGEKHIIYTGSESMCVCV